MVTKRQKHTQEKSKISKDAVRPDTILTTETMYLINKDEARLRLFEKKILRRILGPKRTNDRDYCILKKESAAIGKPLESQDEDSKYEENNFLFKI